MFQSFGLHAIGVHLSLSTDCLARHCAAFIGGYLHLMAIVNFTTSDNLIFMKEMTATEVARNFSEVLDAVEAGEEIVVLRGKREIARILPTKPPVPNGKALIEWYEKRAAAGELLGNDPEWVETMELLQAENERQRKEMKNEWDKSY